MDDCRFDQIARSMAGIRSRRAFAKALAGGAFAGLAAVVGAGGASAKQPPQECRNKGETCNAVKACCEGLNCCKGHCQEAPCKPCANGQKICEGKCTHVKNDKWNCGECGNICPAGRVCKNGECGCPAGTTECRGACVPPRSFAEDDDNCGACGNACVDGLVCNGGACVLPPVCRPGVGECAPLGESCAALPCCSGACAGGTCACVAEGGTCADQYDCCFGSACTDGVCQRVEEGTPCSTDANCGNGSFCLGSTCRACESGGASIPPITVDDCPWPMPGFVCPQDPATGYPGFGYCCIPGVSCGGDPCARYCPSEWWGSGGGDVCNGL
jgi:hypothetical protein